MDQWKLNQEFLYESILRGHEFILCANAYSVDIHLIFYAEIQYLLSQGYRIVDAGWRMIK